MRFSIRGSNWGRFNVHAGNQRLVVHRSLISIFSFTHTWRWKWIDREDMSLIYRRHTGLSYSWYVAAGDNILCSTEPSYSRSEWKIGESVIKYKASYRPLKGWRDYFSRKYFSMQYRQILAFENGVGIATWRGEPFGVFEGVIRRSLPGELVSAVFGIIVSLYIPESTG